MSELLLNDDQTAALQEIANIGMGQAGNSLARIWGEFVALSVPRIATVAAARLPELIQRCVGDGRVSAARLLFHGAMRGEALVVISAADRRTLGSLMGFPAPAGDGDPGAQLLHIAETLAGACLGGIARQFEATIGFGAPALIGEDLPARAVVRADTLGVDLALCLEVRFRVEARSLAAHLVMLMPRQEVQGLAVLLDRFLCTL
ncbi:MAG: chemotaxis protein CheC [Pseudomonadota bacterium]|nr:chemotaxis protein CheC [Pseudomonadota bacterium]